MNSGYAENNGVRIYFEMEDNRKPVLVLLHGNGESMESLEKQREYFKDKFSVLCVDSRGHGQSDMGGQSLSFKLMAEDLYTVFNSLRIPKASILGFSDGANLAMTFAIKYPDRVDRLILAGGNMTPSGCKLGFVIPTIISYGLCSLAAKLDENNSHHKELLRLMLKEPNLNENELKKITARTLIVVGKRDMIKLSHTKKMHKAIKDSTLVIIEGADHFAIYTMADEFNGIVSDFFENE